MASKSWAVSPSFPAATTDEDDDDDVARRLLAQERKYENLLDENFPLFLPFCGLLIAGVISLFAQRRLNDPQGARPERRRRRLPRQVRPSRGMEQLSRSEKGFQLKRNEEKGEENAITKQSNDDDDPIFPLQPLFREGSPPSNPDKSRGTSILAESDAPT